MCSSDLEIDVLQATISDLLSRIVALEESVGQIFFTKSGSAFSITAKQDGSTVTTGFIGVASKVIVMTLTKPPDTPIFEYDFSGWTKDGVSIVSGNDGFIINNSGNTSTLTFTYAAGKDGTYQGNVSKYTTPPYEEQ